MGFRQLQDTGGRVHNLQKTVAVVDGGTNASLREEAITNLGAIPNEMLDTANGIAQLQNNAHYPLRYFDELGVEPSVTIIGPKILTKGKTATYYISNYDLSLQNTVSITSGATVSIDGSVVTVTIPVGYTGSYVDLQINSKQYRIPVSATEIQKPRILSPEPNERVPSIGLTITSSRFATNDESEFTWIPCVENQRTVIAVPVNAVGVAVRGHHPVSGFANISIGEATHRLGVSKTILREYFVDETFFSISLGVGSFAEYAFIYPTVAPVATDWQVSYTSDFSSPVIDVQYQTAYLRRAVFNIGSGVSADREIFVRCRHRTASLSSPWSDPVSARIMEAGYRYSYFSDNLKLPYDNANNQFFKESVGVSLSAAKKTFLGDRAEVFDTLLAVGVPASTLKSTPNAGVVLLYAFNDTPKKQGVIVDENRLQHINTITAPGSLMGSGDFGRDVLLHGDRLFVSDPGRQKVFIYSAQTDSDASYALQQTIDGPMGSLSWGNALAAYDDVLLIGRPSDTTSGIVQLYRLVGDQYVFQKNINAEENSQWFGTAIEVIEGGHLIAISSDAYLSSGVRESRVDFYRESVDGTFNRIYTVKAPVGYGNEISSMFGYKLKYNKEQDSLYVTAPNANYNGKRGVFLALFKDSNGQFTSSSGFESYEDFNYNAAYGNNYFGLGDIEFSPSQAVMFVGHVWKTNGIGGVDVFTRWLNG